MNGMRYYKKRQDMNLINSKLSLCPIFRKHICELDLSIQTSV